MADQTGPESAEAVVAAGIDVASNTSRDDRSRRQNVSTDEDSMALINAFRGDRGLSPTPTRRSTAGYLGTVVRSLAFIF
jgi:hypothetical protein